MTTKSKGSTLSEKFHCIADEFDSKNDCSSSDALTLYEHQGEDGEVYYDAYCYSCCQYFNEKQVHSSSVGSQLGLNDKEFKVKLNIPKSTTQEPMTPNEVRNFINEVGYVSNNYRGIRDDVSKFFGHLTKLNKEGNVVARFYPETSNGGVTGYKARVTPKDFSKGKRGKTGKYSDLSGQVKFRSGGKYILIVGGEEDKAAAYQMLLDSRKDTSYDPIAVVSPTVGESGAAVQCAMQYDFLNSFDNIIIGMDNDDVGRKAAQEIAKVLPEEKVKIATWSGKDPNWMLQNSKEKQFVRDFYAAKSFIDDGVITSVEADTSIEDELSRPKIKLPDFMSALEDKFAGGVPLGYWINWVAMSGIGKTTSVNEAVRKWVYESPYKVGILSLELTASQYMIAMLSREVGYKINLIKDPQEAIKFVNQPHVVAAREHLCRTEEGDERFVILDDREGSLDHVRKQIERLIKKHGCRLIVIDPINDLFDAASWEEQSAFIKWMKIVVKQGVTFSCVCHVRKGATSTDKNGKRIMRELTEDDVSGLSLITKSAGANIFLNRDKYSEDDVVRNTTTVTIGKCRWTGHTGDGGKWYYDNDSHTMYDFDTYFNNKSEKPEIDSSSWFEEEDEIDF